MVKRLTVFSLIITIFLSLVFTAPVSAASKFKDVSDDFWAKSEIDFLSTKGIIKGYDDGTFRPNDAVKRVQAAIMITRALDLDVNNRPDPGFTDIKGLDKEAYNAVAAVVDEGFFPKGETFRPYEVLTRADMAIVLVKAYNLEGTYNGITDVSGELLNYVSALAFNGITQIYEDGTYKPNNSVKRAHFSVFFARILEPYYRVYVNTRENPAIIGDVWTINVEDWLEGYMSYDIELTDMITDGQQAWELLQEANMFNEEAPEGQKYILAKFRFTLLDYEGKVSSSFSIDQSKFSAVSSNGVVYDNPFVITPEPQLSNDLYVGGEVEGWVPFLINEDDTPLIVWQRDWDDELWFSLEG
ncbi:S-layer homology domain-containing protein [Bacillus sp. HMF5848]|uniref:S-layer homology domain-containing protein n=1 Tax=Bacillus sp. HMF5848 TaxID=2495421 RepID=UPI000F77D0F7|nr:S-layer homology domain-containing protein [Bacillus sp. HMF5848]RSK26588.1 S-layer homology domain-containing protein [Bacillus sp. HMF5848]